MAQNGAIIVFVPPVKFCILRVLSILALLLFSLDFILEKGTSQKGLNKTSEFNCFLGVEPSSFFINEESLSTPGSKRCPLQGKPNYP